MNTIKYILKMLMAGIVAVGILSLILCCYSITPVHIENKLGNTDYVWSANSFWVKLTEGIAFGQYDSVGFNNIQEVENPDIIILGSSHMEATNVMQDENVAYLLGEKFSEKYKVYNMGISGHHFIKVCQYLPNSLELYENTPKVVIIETSTVDITEDDVNSVLNRTVEYTSSHSNGIIGMLQRVPFFRLLYHQLEGGLLKIFIPEQIKSPIQNTEETIALSDDISDDLNAYTKLFEYFTFLEDKYNTEIIIFYHPTCILNSDGTASFTSSSSLAKFSSEAQKAGVTFVDMTTAFETMYHEENFVPHGFVTGKVASGHLNKHGHAAVAKVLYEKISSMEEAGILCK